MSQETVTRYYECADGACSILRLGHYSDEDEIYLAVFKSCSGRHSTWCCWQSRFRHIWRILTTGEPYGDELVLRLEESKRLAADLSTVIQARQVVAKTESSPPTTAS